MFDRKPDEETVEVVAVLHQHRDPEKTARRVKG